MKIAIEESVERHESYGVVGFAPQTGGPENLFGSSIKHGTTIRLRVKRASRRRNLSNYWVHGEENIVELTLSPNQFATLLTSMNCGEGVPCTIEYVGGKRMADPPSIEQRELFEKEFEENVKSVTKDARNALKEISEIFEKPNVNKSDRAQIIGKIQKILNLLTDSIPFVQSQFNEAMDKTVTEAKAEVDSFIETKIHSLGIEALNSEVKAALTATRECPVLMLEQK